jgi:hypothetical protein
MDDDTELYFKDSIIPWNMQEWGRELFQEL